MLYNFCPKCGGKLKAKKDDLGICTKCGFHFYTNPEFTTAAIIENEKGEVLLVKRAVEPKKEYWDLPGGFVKIKETLEESVRREINEELAINLGDLKYLSSHCDRYLYQGVNKFINGVNFTAHVSNEIVLKPKDDIIDAKFFSLKEIPWGQLAFSNIKQALEDFINTKRSI